MYVIAALYQFTRFPDPDQIANKLEAWGQEYDIRGLLLVAKEGLNGTIAADRNRIEAMLARIKTLPGCAELEWKESQAQTRPFAKFKVKRKAEIVTMGQADIDPTASVGTYVSPAEWNDLIQADDVVVIDTRNAYEVDIGTFKGAINPHTESFREFPSWWEENASRFDNKRVAMFCTGGIRCEKSTSYLKVHGAKEVYHLHGGILKYLEEVPEEDSLWDGHCFVFDERVSVSHGLQEGPHLLCRACRRPILPDDRERPEYEEGVSCHHCIDEKSEADKARFRERQKQIALSQARGEHHMRVFEE